eukprot:TRINITY_DN11678_c0_g2_i1.p1 TRINITY_DN11678_c0_g2~~TRINITY_DN11678_c0_g2_i1.p1  ORF type:complete len:829 (+),score=115.99 TRINITY_DN11678_c0_g2_i1:75-2489(+)
MRRVARRHRSPPASSEEYHGHPQSGAEWWPQAAAGEAAASGGGRALAHAQAGHLGAAASAGRQGGGDAHLPAPEGGWGCPPTVLQQRALDLGNPRPPGAVHASGYWGPAPGGVLPRADDTPYALPLDHPIGPASQPAFPRALPLDPDGNRDDGDDDDGRHHHRRPSRQHRHCRAHRHAAPLDPGGSAPGVAVGHDAVGHDVPPPRAPPTRGGADTAPGTPRSTRSTLNAYAAEFRPSSAPLPTPPQPTPPEPGPPLWRPRRQRRARDFERVEWSRGEFVEVHPELLVEDAGGTKRLSDDARVILCTCGETAAGAVHVSWLVRDVALPRMPLVLCSEIQYRDEPMYTCPRAHLLDTNVHWFLLHGHGPPGCECMIRQYRRQGLAPWLDLIVDVSYRLEKDPALGPYFPPTLGFWNNPEWPPRSPLAGTPAGWGADAAPCAPRAAEPPPLDPAMDAETDATGSHPDCPPSPVRERALRGSHRRPPSAPQQLAPPPSAPVPPLKQLPRVSEFTSRDELRLEYRAPRVAPGGDTVWENPLWAAAHAYGVQHRRLREQYGLSGARFDELVRAFADPERVPERCVNVQLELVEGHCVCHHVVSVFEAFAIDHLGLPDPLGLQTVRASNPEGTACGSVRVDVAAAYTCTGMASACDRYFRDLRSVGPPCAPPYALSGHCVSLLADCCRRLLGPHSVPHRADEDALLRCAHQLRPRAECRGEHQELDLLRKLRDNARARLGTMYGTGIITSMWCDASRGATCPNSSAKCPAVPIEPAAGADFAWRSDTSLGAPTLHLASLGAPTPPTGMYGS